MVTVFWVPTMTGSGETVVQKVGEAGFVVDCKVKPTALGDQVKMTFALEGMMVSCAGDENRFVGEVPASHS